MTMNNANDLFQNQTASVSLFPVEVGFVTPFYRTPKEDVDDLDEAKNRLNVAERLIRMQEERIRQLEGLAQTDELTGLMNRRGILTIMKREIAASRRDRTHEGVLVMIDLDGFKTINDTWGHSAGDAYLQTVAKLLINEIRPSDCAARLGGDEFALLLMSIDERTGTERVAEFEKRINTKVMQWQGKNLPIRASFGSACYAAGDTPEAVMHTADLKLYAHKARHGRKASRQIFTGVVSRAPMKSQA